MQKFLRVMIMIGLLLPALSFAEEFKKQSEAEGKALVDSNPEVKKWGEATLVIKDEKGNVISTHTEKYPIPESSLTKANNPPENCWNYCRRVCDGYGVCWVSCGLHCSPWTK